MPTPLSATRMVAARANGLKVLPPDINRGEYRFLPLDEQTISYGLGSIKGTGEAAIAAIVAAREKGGPFKDLFDLCERVDKRIVNRRVIEALIRGGAFDAIDDHRARLLASVGIALGAAEQAERNAQQVSLFGGVDEVAHALPQIALWHQPALLGGEQVVDGPAVAGKSALGPIRDRLSSQSNTVNTVRCLAGDPRMALPWRTRTRPHSPKKGARAFREKSTSCRCRTSLRRRPQP